MFLYILNGFRALFLEDFVRYLMKAGRRFGPKKRHHMQLTKCHFTFNDENGNDDHRNNDIPKHAIYVIQRSPYCIDTNRLT